MIQSMRWYGPDDPVPLSALRQAGCSAAVTALHHIPVGGVWSKSEILERKNLLRAAGLEWKVVESLPVHEDIKKRTADFPKYIETYKESIRNLGECGVRVVTYNFMPVLDWVRTDPAHALPTGAKTLRFERLAFAAFDLFLLQRPGAEKDYPEPLFRQARQFYLDLSEAERKLLFENILLGLPGSKENFTGQQVLAALKEYQEIDAQSLRTNLTEFLSEIIPVADESGVCLAIHPDDPPFPVLGLPRVVSTQADLEHIFRHVPSTANGLCFCTGSLGVRPDNDLLSILRTFGDRVHFLHLRNTTRDAHGNFMEADHLDGDTDMVAIVAEVIRLMQQRNERISMRPDHGFQMLDDLNKSTYPGYSAIGRLKGLAELRGVELALHRTLRAAERSLPGS